MTNELKNCYLMSKNVAPDRKLSFPYNKLEGNIAINYGHVMNLKPFLYSHQM